EQTLTELRTVLAQHRAVLVGPRAMGKTTLARAYACSEGHRFPSGTLWGSVAGETDFPGLLARLTRAWAGCHPDTRALAVPTSQDVRRCLGLAPGRLLIVLDDVPNRDVLRSLVAELVPTEATILVTSRWPDVADIGPSEPWPRVHVQRLG